MATTAPSVYGTAPPAPLSAISARSEAVSGPGMAGVGAAGYPGQPAYAETPTIARTQRSSVYLEPAHAPSYVAPPAGTVHARDTAAPAATAYSTDTGAHVPGPGTVHTDTHTHPHSHSHVAPPPASTTAYTARVPPTEAPPVHGGTRPVTMVSSATGAGNAVPPRAPAMSAVPTARTAPTAHTEIAPTASMAPAPTIQAPSVVQVPGLPVRTGGIVGQGTSLRATIKNVDMTPEMQTVCVDLALEALQSYTLPKDMAAFTKKSLDIRYGPTWQSIVGIKYGSYVTHEVRHFIYFYLGDYAFLFWRA